MFNQFVRKQFFVSPEQFPSKNYGPGLTTKGYPVGSGRSLTSPKIYSKKIIFLCSKYINCTILMGPVGLFAFQLFPGHS
jgi:hypothetical protein